MGASKSGTSRDCGACPIDKTMLGARREADLFRPEAMHARFGIIDSSSLVGIPILMLSYRLPPVQFLRSTDNSG
jgi:hypothetical protein